jgi:alpha-L-arabinofuranosidase
MFSARESNMFGSAGPESLDSVYARENILLVSASRSTAPDPPAVQLSLVNTSLSQAVKLSVKLAGPRPTSVAGSVLTAPTAAASEGFEASSVSQPVPFHGAVLKGKTVAVTVPARSVVVLSFSG